MSWMVRRRSWRTSSWICVTVSGVVQLVGLPSPCVFVIVNWRATSLEPGMPLKHPRTTQALVPVGLLNHCEGLRSTFPKIGTKFDAHSLFLSRIHRENRHRSRKKKKKNACKNSALPPSYVQLGTLTLCTWESYHLPAIPATTPAVEVAASVSKILDPPLYTQINLSTTKRANSVLVTYMSSKDKRENSVPCSRYVFKIFCFYNNRPLFQSIC
jgi:hypothetical protein